MNSTILPPDTSHLLLQQHVQITYICYYRAHVQIKFNMMTSERRQEVITAHFGTQPKFIHYLCFSLHMNGVKMYPCKTRIFSNEN